MDVVFLGLSALMFALTVAMVVGCEKLGVRK
jgi:hypothetical protein